MLKDNKILPSLDLEFQSYLKNEKTKLARFMCILSSVLFASFIIVDIWALSSVFSTAITIRGMVIAALITTYFITYTALFDKFYNLIISSMYIVAVAGIEAMVFIATPADQAYETYFVGIILILITLFSWTYLKLKVSVPLALISILAYVYIEVVARDLVGNDRYSALITNVFFLFSSALIGFIAQVMRDGYLRQNFLLQQSLKDTVKEKTIEADDNAYIANHDALTKLPNRRYITELLEDSLQLAKEREKVLAILFLDLNGFKQVNDVYGHAVGDSVLVIVAKRLELAVRQGDNLSRLGGDEYLVSLMMDNENIADIERMAVKFTEIISKPMNIDGLRIKVGVSIGIAAYPMHGNKVGVLLDIADKKMYKVKQGKESTNLDNDHVASEAEPIVFFTGHRKLKKIK